MMYGSRRCRDRSVSPLCGFADHHIRPNLRIVELRKPTMSYVASITADSDRALAVRSCAGGLPVEL